jgi:hypothetical protein
MGFLFKIGMNNLQVAESGEYPVNTIKSETAEIFKSYQIL